MYVQDKVFDHKILSVRMRTSVKRQYTLVLVDFRRANRCQSSQNVIKRQYLLIPAVFQSAKPTNRHFINPEIGVSRG